MTLTNTGDNLLCAKFVGCAGRLVGMSVCESELKIENRAKEIVSEEI